jgi:hypothetical protein
MSVWIIIPKMFWAKNETLVYFIKKLINNSGAKHKEKS